MRRLDADALRERVTTTLACLLVLLLALAVPSSASAAPGLDERPPDAEFFAAFRSDMPELASVRAAVAQKDYPRARRELAGYYRHRLGKFWWFDAHAVDRKVKSGPAGLAMAQRIRDRSGEFDPSWWLPDGDLNWQRGGDHANWGRMYFWGALGAGYWFSGTEEPVATEWVKLLRSWVRLVPPGSNTRYWNTMHTGIRMRSGWPEAFNYFLLSPTFTDDDLILFLKSTLEQTRYLREKHSATSNWLTFEMAGLYSSGVMYPEFTEAADWRSHAAQVAVTDMQRGYLPDGSSIELCPGYHQFFSNYLLMRDLATVVGREKESGLEQLVASTEEPYAYLVRLMAPDRTMPAYNDNRPLAVTGPLAKAAELFPQRSDFAWISSGGTRGQEPAYTSVYLPYAGAGAMRSDWSTTANYLGFDFGPVGYRHAHQDKLNVVLWAYGRQVLFDPGRWDYSDTPYQRYCSDTFSHNTVLVDNRPQRRPWYANPRPEQMPYQPLTDVRWKTKRAYDYAAGVYDEAYGLPGPSNSYPYSEGSDFRKDWGYPARHHRRVLFLKPDLFLVVDTLVSKDGRPHNYEARWHLDSLQVTPGEDHFSVRTADPRQPNLQLVPLTTDGLTVRAVSAQTEPELLGWRVIDKPLPATTVCHSRSGAGQVTFATLLLPLRPEQTTGLRSVRQEGEGTFVVVREDGREVRLRVPSDPALQLRGELLRSHAGVAPSTDRP